MTVHINPSILSADFTNLRSALDEIETADAVHVDIMDNHFVPNLTFGLPVVKQIAKVSPVPLDVHLMIDDPDRWAVGFAECGAETVTFHLEAAASPITLARRIRAAGAKAGVALRPTTPAAGILDALAEFDQVLVMTVEPGFGGQTFLFSALPKLREIAAVAPAGLALEVDGGITTTTAPIAVDAGADVLVAGSSVYSTKSHPVDAIAALRAASKK